MKTTKDASIEYRDEIALTYSLTDAFNSGVDFAEQFISVEEELPPHITKPMPQTNGNTLYFYENYIVKGYYKNEGKTEDILMATYRPNSVSWYFLVHKQEGTFNFIVTHWIPINKL